MKLEKRIKELSTSGESESKLKTKLVNLLRSRLGNVVVFRHEDQFTAAIPDITLTGNKKTIWIETKFANPTVRGKDIQKYTAKRLALAGYCFYVIYYLSNSGEERTFIVEPKNIESWLIDAIAVTERFDHDFVVNFMEDLLSELGNSAG